MQRWIVVASAVLFLLVGGGAFTYWKVRQNKPDFSYIPLPFTPESTASQREETVKGLRERLITDPILIGLVRDCNIEKQWKLPSEQAAVEELKKRVIFKPGETTIQGIKMETLNIGFNGIVSEHRELQSLSNRLMEDVQRILSRPGQPETVPTKF